MGDAMTPRDGVVCLHANASSAAQWRSLAERIGDRFEVVAVDGLGVGASPEWPRDEPARLELEADRFRPLLDRASGAVHLVGHSFGGAVAMLVAASCKDRMRSVAVYEPTLFALVAGADPARSPAAGIWHAATDAADAHGRGDAVAAAARFVDFWSGEGTFAAMPERRRGPVVHAARDAGRWRDAVFGASLTEAAVAALDVPVLLLSGGRSPESSLAVVRRLSTLLPRLTLATFAELGHMGPLADPARVDARIEAFLDHHRSAAERRADRVQRGSTLQRAEPP